MPACFSFIFCSLLAWPAISTAQECRLTGKYDESITAAALNWSMISCPIKTRYVLLKSIDKKNWTELITGNPLQNYSERDVFEYDDQIKKDQKYYYRIKIIGPGNNTIAFSNIVYIGTEEDIPLWQIYPDPVSDVLHLACPGNDLIKGVINVTVQDVTGKVIIRYRAASTNKSLEIPVQQLGRGIYVAQIFILNQMVMDQKFVKQ